MKQPSKMSSISKTSGTSQYKIVPKEEPKNEEVERQMMEISTKLEKANSAKKKRRSELINRIHSHNTS